MKKTIIVIALLLITLGILVYGYEFMFKKPITESPTISENSESPMLTKEIKEQYKDSVYTFVGTEQLPTPCHTLKSKINLVSEGIYQIEVTTVAPPPETICAQVVTEKSYKVSFKAGEKITVTALINGIEYKLNRFVIPLDKNIDTFDLKIKG